MGDVTGQNRKPARIQRHYILVSCPRILPQIENSTRIPIRSVISLGEENPIGKLSNSPSRNAPKPSTITLNGMRDVETHGEGFGAPKLRNRV